MHLQLNNYIKKTKIHFAIFVLLRYCTNCVFGTNFFGSNTISWYAIIHLSPTHQFFPAKKFPTSCWQFEIDHSTEIDKCYKSRLSPISPIPGCWFMHLPSPQHWVKCIQFFLFFFLVYMFCLPCCQREEHFCFLVVFLLSLQICCKYIQVQSP